jgi:hypothetical protein
MKTTFNLDIHKWQNICQDASFIAENYPTYGRYQIRVASDVLETALYIGLDAMKDEITQHQTLEWVVRERQQH